ncbi:protein kinase domain-containing protein [Yinghuangia aomiensis]
MSPEQAQGHAVDARADQYSLGCVLFELLTGHTPFTGDSVFAVMNQHLGRPADPPSQRRAEVPAALDAVVLRMLAKDPEQRYAAISDVRAALDAFADRQAAYSAPPAAAPNAGGVPARPAAPPTVKSTRAASAPTCRRRRRCLPLRRAPRRRARCRRRRRPACPSLHSPPGRRPRGGSPTR